MAGVSLEQAYGPVHRALARAWPVRLKIWRGLFAVPDGVAPEGDIARLYEAEAPRLRRRLARRLDGDAAGDLVQSAFVRLLGMGEDRIGLVAHPRSLLRRIADNLANDDAKSARRRLEQGGIELEAAGPDPHSALEARDMLRRIEAAIPLLPDRTRAIFIAHRFDEFTYGEIAERMGLSIKTVEKHISFALRELHRAVGDLGGR